MTVEFGRYLKIVILLFGLSLILKSCQKEDDNYIIAQEQGPKLNIELVSLEHLASRSPDLIDKISPLKEAKSSPSQFQRTNSEVYDFSIDEEQVQVIVLNEFTTYTFMVERDDPIPFELENYTLKVNNDGTYEQYILTYHYALDENGNKIYDHDVLEIESIEDESLVLYRTAYCERELIDVVTYEACTTSNTCYGPGADGDHETGDDQCQCQVSVTTCFRAGTINCQNETVWIYGCSNGGSSGNTNSNEQEGPEDTTGGAQNPNSNTSQEEQEEDYNDNVTAVPFDPVKKHQENCRSLNQLSQDDELSANINPLVQELRTKTNEENEYSVNFKKNINYGEEYSFANDDGIIEGDSKTSSTIYWGSQQFGCIHTHPVGTIYMFSWKDVARLRLVYDNLHSDFTKQDVFLMIVNGDGTVYALKVDDIEAFQNNLDQDMDNLSIDTLGLTEDDIIAKKEDNLNEKLAVKYRESNDNEAVFLNQFNGYGISLYKADDQNLSSWSKLELTNLSTNGSNVTSKPCN